MAPELVADPDGMAATGWGPEIDMWAVGILVFWMLCGRTPFDDDNVPQILQNIMQVRVSVSQDDRACHFKVSGLPFSLLFWSRVLILVENLSMYEAQLLDQEQQSPDVCPLYQGVFKEETTVQNVQGSLLSDMASLKGNLYKFAGAVGVQ